MKFLFVFAAVLIVSMSHAEEARHRQPGYYGNYGNYGGIPSSGSLQNQCLSCGVNANSSCGIYPTGNINYRIEGYCLNYTTTPTLNGVSLATQSACLCVPVGSTLVGK